MGPMVEMERGWITWMLCAGCLQFEPLLHLVIKLFIVLYDIFPFYFILFYFSLSSSCKLYQFGKYECPWWLNWGRRSCRSAKKCGWRMITRFDEVCPKKISKWIHQTNHGLSRTRNLQARWWKGVGSTFFDVLGSLFFLNFSNVSVSGIFLSWLSWLTFESYSLPPPGLLGVQPWSSRAWISNYIIAFHFQGFKVSERSKGSLPKSFL